VNHAVAIRAQNGEIRQFRCARRSSTAKGEVVMNFTELMSQLRIPFCEIKSTGLARQSTSSLEHERFLISDQFRFTLASKVLHQFTYTFFRFLIHIQTEILATLSFAHDSLILRFVGVVTLEAVCLENPIDASRQTLVRNVRSISPECVEMIV
jgi:hypothetical protein